MDEKINKLMELLEPCLKKEKHNGSEKYKTAWGYKTDEGLRAAIKAVLEEEEKPTEWLPKEGISIPATKK